MSVKKQLTFSDEDWAVFERVAKSCRMTPSQLQSQFIGRCSDFIEQLLGTQSSFQPIPSSLQTTNGNLQQLPATDSNLQATTSNTEQPTATGDEITTPFTF